MSAARRAAYRYSAQAIRYALAGEPRTGHAHEDLREVERIADALEHAGNQPEPEHAPMDLGVKEALSK